jgi:membrane protease YdiL (CAAX protease family)
MPCKLKTDKKMKKNKLFSLLVFFIFLAVFIFGNLFKGTIAMDRAIFSLGNILAVGLVFIIGILILYYFQKRKKR